MVSKSIITVLALIATASVPSAVGRERHDVIVAVSIAQFAGLDDRCPRYKLIESALQAELQSVGLAKGFELASADDHEERRIAITDAVRAYENSPARFCLDAWAKIGPHGTFKRQMLETK